MIQKLMHARVEIAEKIRAIFQVSYAVEADLLKAINFPPLQRNVSDFIRSTTDFHGYFKGDHLVGIIEIKNTEYATHIQSLVVDPLYFRQGIGNELLTFSIECYNTKTFSVETGLDNEPAISLYKKFGFRETKQWDTDHGVRKVRFEKKEAL